MGLRRRRPAGGPVLLAQTLPICLAATAALIARVLFVAADRAVWALVCAAAIALTAGEVIGDAAPTAADLCALAAAPPLYVALVRRSRRMITGLPSSLWLDGLLLCLLAVAAAAAFLLPTTQAATGDILHGLLAGAGPAGGLGVLGFLLGSLAMSGRLARQSILLGAGCVLLVVSQVLAALAMPAAPGAAAQLLTAAGLCALAVASLLPLPAARTTVAGGWWELGSPAVVAVLAGAILVADHVSRQPTLAVVLAPLTLVAALARMTWMLREVRFVAMHRAEARTDELTGLPNRRALTRELEVLTAGGGTSSRRFSLLQLDLDGLKELNDTLGHQAGDELLVQVADRLRGVLPRTPARVGGDEFAAVVTGGMNPEAVAEAARAVLDEPIDVDGVAVAVNASIGIARFPEDATDARELARRADVAMYDAKRSGIGVARYFPERDEHSTERLSLAADLRRAFDRDELWLAYQPQVDIAGGRISGAEALIRWRHPVRGDVPPGVLLPVAERAGLMPRLTTWVLERAVAQAALWRRSGLDVRVAVNVSAVVLVDAGLPERIDEVLRRHSLTPDNLVVEITEDAVMAEPRRAIAILERLEQLRVGIAIDDFGTGHSSLEQLKRLPAHELKLDRSFVMGMTEDGDDAAIVASVVGLGRALELRVVAEGVESPAIWQALAELGCDVAQGFGIARPMPAAQFEQWAREPTDRARLLVPNLHASTGPRRRAPQAA